MGKPTGEYNYYVHFSDVSAALLCACACVRASCSRRVAMRAAVQPPYGLMGDGGAAAA